MSKALYCAFAADSRFAAESEARRREREETFLFAVSNATTSCANGLIISKIKNKSEQSELCSDMAEKEGFEPSRRVNAYTISSRAPSTKLGDFSVPMNLS